MSLAAGDELNVTDLSACNSSSANCSGQMYEYSPLPPLQELVPVTLVYGLTLIVGVLGNSLVIFSIGSYRRLRSITNIFLVSLSSADLLLILLCVPIKFAQFLSFTWTFGEFLCKFVHYIQNVSVICSVITLTAMSMERYYAILHPMKAKYSCTTRRTKKVICFLWAFSLLAAIPIIFEREHLAVGLHLEHHWCLKKYKPLHEIYMFVVIFVIPLTIMTYCYTRICFRLWAVTAWRASMRAGLGGGTAQPVPSTRITDTNGITVNAGSYRQLNGSSSKPSLGNGSKSNHAQSGVKTEEVPLETGEDGGFRSRTNTNSSMGAPQRTKSRVVMDDTNTRKQVIKMLMAIIILFSICWGPILLNNLLIAFEVWPRLNRGFFKPMRQAFYLMAYFNSCVNPIVYGFMSKNFRQSFIWALCKCIKGRAEGRGYAYPGGGAGAGRAFSSQSQFTSTRCTSASTRAVTIGEEQVALRALKDRL